MILTYAYRLLPTKRQHRALETILESQRQLYNAALEERIEAYRKANIRRTYFDQTKALTEWRQCDSEARSVPANLQRGTLKRLDEASLPRGVCESCSALWLGRLSAPRDGKKRDWACSDATPGLRAVALTTSIRRVRACYGITI